MSNTVSDLLFLLPHDAKTKKIVRNANVLLCTSSKDSPGNLLRGVLRGSSVLREQ